MQQSLADLISAHKFLCEAVAGQGVGSGSSARQKSSEKAPPVSPQNASSVAYLTDEEEDQIEKQMGFEPEPFMDRIVADQFATLFEQREEARLSPEAPKVITQENRQEIRPAAKIPTYANVRPGPTPIPRVVESVPPEIAKRDELQKQRWEAPENFRAAVPFDQAKVLDNVFDEFNGMQKQG